MKVLHLCIITSSKRQGETKDRDGLVPDVVLLI